MADPWIPDRATIGRALLELLRDGQVHHDDEIVGSLVKRFEIDESRLPIFKSGRSKFGNEIDWVKGDLGEGKRGKKLIRRLRSKQYQILPAGLATFSN